MLPLLPWGFADAMDISLCPQGTSYLYSLREDGHILHAQIKQLQYLEEPWCGAIPVIDQLDCYEIEVARHWVSFQAKGDLLTILDIEPLD